MTFSRRTLLGSAGGIIAASAISLPRRAFANDTSEYFYDALGRLIRVELSDGTIVVYDYDAAGNRTRAVHGDDVPFNETLQITGTGPVNLRTVADQAGYTGVTNATITFQVGSAITVTGMPGSYGIDTGTWPTGYSLTLSLQVSGKVYGSGGGGGSGGGSGGAGGDAVYCRQNMSITVNAGGQIRAGGGGGGGGASWQYEFTSADPPETVLYYGGGGGGGFPNGSGGGGGPGGTGSAGSSGGGGSGGSSASILGGRTVGAGGAGGVAASTGTTGSATTGASGCSGVVCRTIIPAGAGGAPGYAVRKNGKTVSVTNNGTISGTVG